MSICDVIQRRIGVDAHIRCILHRQAQISPSWQRKAILGPSSFTCRLQKYQEEGASMVRSKSPESPLSAYERHGWAYRHSQLKSSGAECVAIPRQQTFPFLHCRLSAVVTLLKGTQGATQQYFQDWYCSSLSEVRILCEHESKSLKRRASSKRKKRCSRGKRI